MQGSDDLGQDRNKTIGRLAEILDRPIEFLRRNPALKERLRTILDRSGYGTTDWVREVMYEDCFAFIRSLDPGCLDVLEISAGPHWRRAFAFGSFSETHYPAFDICRDVHDRQFDLIVADQVFEHLPWPRLAAANVHRTLRPGGHFIVACPFMVRLHEVPIDCSRWSETGLSYLLQEAGFASDAIVTRSWGNRACVKANLTRWVKRGFFGSLKNEKNFPVMVWAFARK